MIIEGAKGQPCKPVEKFDLTTRLCMDEWITERSTDFIVRTGAAGTPFFLYSSFTIVHTSLAVHPGFAGSSGSPDLA